MKDIKDQDLVIGDKVVFTMKTYAALIIGEVETIRPSYIVVKYDFKTWDNKDKVGYREIRDSKTQVLKLG